jgi:hypothetical protein
MIALVSILVACTRPDVAKGDAEPTDTDPATDTDTDTDTGGPCPAGRAVVGALSGAAASRADVVVAVFDAADWRFGDATPLSDVARPASGAFTVCLDAAMPFDGAFGKAFLAAWADLDGDARLDARAEPLCDREADGTTTYLYFDGSSWSVGLERRGEDDLAAAWTPTLDGDRCP